MSSFFDKFSETVTNTSKDALDKAKDLGNKAKIKSEIANEEHIIKNMYQKIGEIYYKNYSDLQDDLFIQQIDNIQKAEKAIESKKKELEQFN